MRQLFTKMESAFQQALKNLKTSSNYAPKNILNQAQSFVPFLKTVPKAIEGKIVGVLDKAIEASNRPKDIRGDLERKFGYDYYGRPLSSTATPTPTLTPTRIPTPTPQATLIPTPTMAPPVAGEGFRLNIPSSQDANKITKVPQNLAQLIGEIFEPIQQATAAATVLHHPYGEQLRGMGYGENAGFITGKGWENKETGVKGDYNYDDSGNLKYIMNPYTGEQEPNEDRGLFRINNETFYLLQGSRKWNSKMKKAGIYSYDDMYDPEKNIRMARIMGDWRQQDLKMPRWSGWFAAPKNIAEW